MLVSVSKTRGKKTLLNLCYEKKKDIHSNNRAPKKNDKHFILRVRSLGLGSTATVKKKQLPSALISSWYNGSVL